jgi:23S rRNA (pseudouridine1915-N3)-methyltransferase
MRVTILSVATDAGVDPGGFHEIHARMPPEVRVELVELKPGKSKADEGAARCEPFPRGATLLALDEQGKRDHPGLSVMLAEWMRDATHPCFAIGGADGLSDEVKQRAAKLISLSALTLPHQLVRVCSPSSSTAPGRSSRAIRTTANEPDRLPARVRRRRRSCGASSSTRSRPPHEVRAVSYPNARWALDGYRDHAMARTPVDWKPDAGGRIVLGLVAARWAAVDARVPRVVLCGSFARNPVGHAASLGAIAAALVKLGPAVHGPIAHRLGRRAPPALGRRPVAGADALTTSDRRAPAPHRLDGRAPLAPLRVPGVRRAFRRRPGDRARRARHLEAVVPACARAALDGPHFALETRPGVRRRDRARALA